MKRTYFCPKCESTLNPNVKIILTLQTGGDRHLVLLSPQPGNYDVIVSEDARLAEEALVKFLCPVCNAELLAADNPQMAEIGFRLPSGTQGVVKFSRRFGEQATFFVTEEWTKTYGEDAGLYSGMNFFGAGRELD